MYSPKKFDFKYPHPIDGLRQTDREEDKVHREAQAEGKELSEKEKEIIREAKARYRLGARRLEKVIEQVYGIHIPHNRIHKYLLEEGLAKEEPRKKRRRKPYIRYEREHSISAGHIDWFEKDGIKFCAILDDASRKILAAGEFKNANTENSIALVDKLVEDYWGIMPMKELISDVTLNPWA
ncbi:MAG: integrase [Candidatus Syntrophoarchaeum butanivorans]|uniref:Integrase n=1 Tax=Candidatus Syntropharchaeum butanivorans TaxID=1839936 RepID=A0A1F2P6C9_9EURY|nr:MAG: integrase [Candidatus Syntrophoarchaeum butanivorans]